VADAGGAEEPAAEATPPQPLPELLRALLSCPSPSGYEQGAAQLWRTAVDEYAETSEDRLGSVLARLPGRGDGPTVAIFTHIDEIGLIVKAISPDGYLLVDPLGGWDPQILVGQRIEVLTAAGAIPGVIGRRAPHQSTPEERKAVVALKDLRVDIGAQSREQAAALVDIGDPAVIAATPLALPNGRVVSRSLDNRISAYVAAQVIAGLASGDGAAGPVVAVASVQEETSLSGARVAGYTLEPDAAIVIDVTHASDGPGAGYEANGEHPLGSGPTILRGPHASERLVRVLREAAAELAIPHTLEVAGGSTATDADAVHNSRQGIPTAIISVPLRYMHSPVEMVQLSDVEHTVALVIALIQRLGN
jgi:endoglucanase